MNKITKDIAKSYGIDFEDLIEDFEEHSYKKHRKGSNFFTRSIVHLKKDIFDFNLPDEFVGFWETNTYITDTNYGPNKEEIYELNRVVKDTIIVKKEIWKLVDEK